MELEIEYCVPCGLLGAAEQVAHRVLARYGERIAGLAMKPGHGGVFRVSLNDALIFDKSRDRFDLDQILDRVSERAGTGQAIAAPHKR